MIGLQKLLLKELITIIAIDENCHISVLDASSYKREDWNIEIKKKAIQNLITSLCGNGYFLIFKEYA